MTAETPEMPGVVLEAAEALEQAQHQEGRTWLRTIDGRLDIDYEKAAYIALSAAHHPVLAIGDERHAYVGNWPYEPCHVCGNKPGLMGDEWHLGEYFTSINPTEGDKQ